MASGDDNQTRDARIRLGMVGGGRDAFIGGVHRIAARIDDHYELVAGAFSSTAEKSKASAGDLGINAERAYDNYEIMAATESSRADGIEAVSIVTPNHLHFPVAKAFLEQGIHVICDKPLTSTLEDAEALKTVCEKSKALFVLTHNYTGYPVVRQAKAMISNGELGNIRLVQCEYAQDWLSEDLESTGQKQAGWRTDPERTGAGGAIGDIGTHAYNLGCYMSGLTLESLCADLDSFVDGRRVDDNAHVMMRFNGGAKGVLWASQVAPGNENALCVRIYGSKGGLEWRQEDPNYLWFTPLGSPKQLITRSGAGSSDAATRMSRIPPGHPEGYLEGFANIYSEAAAAINAKKNGTTLSKDVHYPSIDDGVAGVRFISACVASSKEGGVWKNVS